MKKIQTKIGLQNSVIGFDDPFHPGCAETYMRTGDGRNFPSQDPAPSADAFMKALKTDLGVDFYVHQVIPDDRQIAGFLKSIAGYDMPFVIGNEFGSANGPYVPGTNRYDVPGYLVEEAKKIPGFMGLLYDETEHLQMNPLIYTKLHPEIRDVRHQWVGDHGQTLEEAEEEFVRTVSGLRDGYGCECFNEAVFPTLLHLFARAGFTPAPKVMQAEYQALNMAVGMGAARQYGRKFNICVDMWGVDVGGWFTRLWGLPGHSPAEFRSALYMAYYMNPDYMYVENCDPIMRSRGTSMELTEFGYIFREFIADVKNRPLPYSRENLRCKVAVVCADDCLFSRAGGFFGGGCFGFPHLPAGKSAELFEVLYVLSGGTMSKDSNTFYGSDRTEAPRNRYPVTDESLKTLPLTTGVPKSEESCVHPLFFPLDGVLVFDDSVRFDELADAELIVVCGSRLRRETAEMLAGIRDRKVIVSRHLSEGFSSASAVGGYLDGTFAEAVAEYVTGKWKVYFGTHTLEITDPSGDGVNLKFDIQKTTI